MQTNPHVLIHYAYLSFTAVVGLSIAYMGYRLYMEKRHAGGAELEYGKLKLGRGGPGALFVLLGASIVIAGVAPQLMKGEPTPEPVEGTVEEVVTPMKWAPTTPLEQRPSPPPPSKDLPTAPAVHKKPSPPVSRAREFHDIIEIETPSRKPTSVSPKTKAVQWCMSSLDGGNEPHKLTRCELYRGFAEVFKPAALACLDEAGLAASEPRVRVSIEGASGQIRPESVLWSSLPNDDARECLDAALLDLRFPEFEAPRQGASFTIHR